MGNSTKDDYRKNNRKIKKMFINNKLSNKELLHLFNEECSYIKGVIINSIISIENKTSINLFSNTDLEIAITCLTGLETRLSKIVIKKVYSIELVNELQGIIDDLTTIICGFGTLKLDDLINICNGKTIKQLIVNSNCEYLTDKQKIISSYIEPTGYKIINWKEDYILTVDDANICIDKNGEECISIEQSNNLECFIYDTGKNFYHKIYGIRVIIQNPNNKITMIINGTITNISANLFKNNKYIKKQLDDLNEIKLNINNYENIFQNIIDSLTIRDLLIYSKNDIYKRVYAVKNEINMIKNTKFDTVVKEFTDNDIISQRSIIINLLLYNDSDKEMQYICNLLYEIITFNGNDNTNM